MKAIITILILLIIPSGLFAQSKGYYVTPKNPSYSDYSSNTRAKIVEAYFNGETHGNLKASVFLIYLFSYNQSLGVNRVVESKFIIGVDTTCLQSKNKIPDIKSLRLEDVKEFNSSLTDFQKKAKAHFYYEAHKFKHDHSKLKPKRFDEKPSLDKDMVTQ